VEANIERLQLNCSETKTRDGEIEGLILKAADIGSASLKESSLPKKSANELENEGHRKTKSMALSFSVQTDFTILKEG
jgi:hypothetical protein